MTDLDRQARHLDRELTSLIKRYQFRDRNEICCDGVTVSQCYVLKELGQEGTLVMTRLAERMCLSPSAVTRVVDQLEARELARRRCLPADRRVNTVEMTAKGRRLLRGIESRIRLWEREVLRQLDPEVRSGLLNGLRHLNEALKTRPPGRHAPEPQEKFA